MFHSQDLALLPRAPYPVPRVSLERGGCSCNHNPLRTGGPSPRFCTRLPPPVEVGRRPLGGGGGGVAYPNRGDGPPVPLRPEWQVSTSPSAAPVTAVTASLTAPCTAPLEPLSLTRVPASVSRPRTQCDTRGIQRGSYVAMWSGRLPDFVRELLLHCGCTRQTTGRGQAFSRRCCALRVQCSGVLC